jgi:hypothetical protein
MQSNIQEFYQQSIFPMSEADQLKLATLILQHMTESGSTPAKERGKASIRNLFGKGRSGRPNGADNELIDADLRRSYLKSNED